jgi:hypothetical protein
MTSTHMSEKPPQCTKVSDSSPAEVSTGGPPTALPEGFLKGVIFAIGFYEKELIRVESHATGYVKRGIQKARGSISRNLGDCLRCLTSMALLAQLISAGLTSSALLDSFNVVFPGVLRTMKSIAQKDSLVSEVAKLCEPVGLRVCQYCGRLRVAVAGHEPYLCPPPASCRKGWHNRQDWLRRKSQHNSRAAKPG